MVRDKRILFSNLPLSHISYKFEFTAIVHDVDSFSSTQSELSESSLRLLLAFVCSFKTFAVLLRLCLYVSLKPFCSIHMGMGKFYAICILISCLCAKLNANDGPVSPESEMNSKSEDYKFIPTKEWQVIPEGNIIYFCNVEAMIAYIICYFFKAREYLEACMSELICKLD